VQVLERGLPREFFGVHRDRVHVDAVLHVLAQDRREGAVVVLHIRPEV